MLRSDELPEENAELAGVRVSFDRLAPDSPETCPVPIGDVLEYLRSESPDGEHLVSSDLEFIRTALVSERRYWIWRFEADEAECYVTVALDPGGQTIVGYDENYYGLSPEQFLLGDFHEVF